MQRGLIGGVLLWAMLGPATVQAQAPVLGALPADGQPVVVQGRVTAVAQESDVLTVVLRPELGSAQPGPWLVVDWLPTRTGVLPATCWRFVGIWAGATEAALTTPLLGLPFTVGAPRIAASTGEAISPNRNTATGCDRPREYGAGTRFDPNTMGPAGTVTAE
jgi:hypothetical protein